MTHDYTDEEIRAAWKDSLSLHAFLAALPERPQAAEIAALKSQIDHLEERDRQGREELVRLRAELREARKSEDHWHSEAELLRAEEAKAQAELAALRQPVLADDGRSLGEMASEAYHNEYGVGIFEKWQIAAQAVASVVLAQAVRRMESVPQEEIWKVYKDAPHRIAQKALESVRARLIAAFKGEGQAQAKPSTRIEITEIPDKKPGPVGTLAYAPPPVGVNEPPKSEGQPDLSGKSEKQDEPAHVHQEPAQPWTPAVGDTVRSIPEMALGGQMYWRDLALQIARVWWKCHNIGASLQHGDLDKDIAFSIVCKRHGGRVFHGDTPENAWHKAEEWLLFPDRENFPAACLTPAQP